MSLSILDFWRLLTESRLLSPQHVQPLAAEFAQHQSNTPPTAQTLAQWLVKRNALSRYQAMILLSGRPGPFYYGEYRVIDRVEKGCLAGRFRAVHVPTGHPVVLKFLSGAVVGQPQLWTAAAGQALAASRIVSPYVQRHFEAVDLEGFKFLVSEDLRGSTLDEQLARGRIAPPVACRLIRLAALGLAQLHAAGRAHGDVRPGTLLLEAVAKQPPNVKLLFEAEQVAGPFDLADQAPGSRLVNAADYLAPELQMPRRACDPPSDLYALGCTLYTLLAGVAPFAAGSISEKLARHASDTAGPLEPLGVPPLLAQVVTRLMARSPAARHSSAAQVAEQIGMFVEPAALRLELPAAPPTLASFEQALRQRQPPTTIAAAAAGLPIVVDSTKRPTAPKEASRFAALAASEPNSSFATAVTGSDTSAAPSAVNLTVGAKPRVGRSVAEIMKQRQAQQRRNLIVGVLGMGLLVATVAAAGGYYWKNQPKSDVRAAATTPAPPSTAAVTPLESSLPPGKAPLDGNAPPDGSSGGSSRTSPASNSAPTPLADDDGKSLWAAPTSGQPISFRCVPPEGQVFFFIRPAALLSSAEGQRVLAALGPALAAQRMAFEAASGFKLDEIDELHITLHNNDAKFPRASFVVKTVEALPPDQLLARWGKPEAVKEQSQTYYTGPYWAYYIPPAPEDERSFAMGAARDIKDVAAAAGAPPPVFREIERLRRFTDQDRHFTLLFYPQFLFNDDGEPLFAGERAKVRQPLAWFLGDHLQAAGVSAHFGESSYFEMRMLAALDKEPFQLAEDIRQRLNAIPTALEDYFVALSPPPYWKKLAFRYPAMIRELHSQTRVGIENDQAIVNSVLPAFAAHNLLLGGELLVATTPGQTAVAAAAAPAAAGPQTIAAALQIKTSYSFDNQSLEFAMRDLAEDVQSNLKGAPLKFAIKIIGDDLKIDGITRNQSIRDFKQESQTVADILTALVRKANPVTTVKDPSELDQKLIWVIGPDPDNPSQQIVLITTRAAAAAKKYVLPAPFVAKPK